MFVFGGICVSTSLLSRRKTNGDMIFLAFGIILSLNLSSSSSEILAKKEGRGRKKREEKEGGKYEKKRSECTLTSVPEL
jgi:hypothetical protein